MLLLGDDSTLVKAAKANGGLKKPMPKKTITNADVKKKSAGKVAESSAATGAPASAAPSQAKDSTLAIFEAHKKAVAAAQKRVDDAAAVVADLEKDLASVEQSYYEASDLNARDTTIVTRFDQTKKQLDDARAKLADARDALAALTPKPRDSDTPQAQ